MAKLLCFDLDGTLVDSAKDIANAVNRTLIELEKPPLEYDLIVSHIGDGLRALLKGVFPEAPKGFDEESLVQRFLDIYEEEMLKSTTLFPGVEEFLLRWTQGGGQIGIITNKNEAPAKILVQHLGLDRFPWVDVFGADTLRERKPSPLPLQTMMAKAGRSPQETLMIGDGTPDMASAKAAGVDAIAIGFGYTTLEILQKYEPLAVLHHYSHFSELIERIPDLRRA